MCDTLLLFIATRKQGGTADVQPRRFSQKNFGVALFAVGPAKVVERAHAVNVMSRCVQPE